MQDLVQTLPGLPPLALCSVGALLRGFVGLLRGNTSRRGPADETSRTPRESARRRKRQAEVTAREVAWFSMLVDALWSSGKTAAASDGAEKQKEVVRLCALDDLLREFHQLKVYRYVVESSVVHGLTSCCMPTQA